MSQGSSAVVSAAGEELDSENGASSASAFGSGRLFGVQLCFLLSGFAALLYQTAWMRQFSIVFGTSELAVAAVLASYMAGLAVGAAVAARIVGRVRRPILVYGLMELGIAGSALAVAPALQLARRLQADWIGGQAELPVSSELSHSLFYLVAAFLIVLVPTALMGATLPVLAKQVVRTDAEVGRRVGALYAINTLGAVLGTLVAAFVLLPRLGLSGTVLAGAGINALVFGLAAVISIGARTPASPPRESTGAADASGASGASGALERSARWVLPLMLISGAISFTYEVLWTRLLSHILGGSVAAFAVMLATFLTGIALGSAIASRLARSRAGGALGFSMAQIGTALASASVFLLLDDLPRIAAERGAGPSDTTGHALLSALVLLPSTLCIGATFPFALRLLARDEREAGLASARVYAWNTVGAIVGAVVAGFFVIPALSYSGSVRLAVIGNLLLASLAILLWRRSARVLLVASLALTALALVLYRPASPTRLLCTSALGTGSSTGRVVYQSVGRSASVILLEEQGVYEIRSNGLPEAVIEPRGAPPYGRNTTWWLASLPVMARPAAHSMLVIGFGGGVTLERVPPSIEELDAIELEPKVLEANREVSDVRAVDPFADPRLTMHLGDARGALALTEERWDVIVSQPSHPWTAGASHLYTREFLTQVRDHLEPGGVFVQWMHAAFLNEELLRILTQTVLEVFPHARLYRPIPVMLVFLASDSPLEPERELARTGEPVGSAPEFYARVGLNGVSDLAALLALDQEGLHRLAGEAPVNSDEENHLALLRPTVEDTLDAQKLADLFFPSDPILDPASPLSVALEGQLDRLHLTRRLYDLQHIHRAAEVMQKMTVPSDRALAASFLAHMISMNKPDNSGRYTAPELWQLGLERDARNPRAQYMGVEPFLGAMSRGQAPAAVTSQAARMTGPGGAVVRAARYVAEEKWDALTKVEPSLAAALPSDPWYPKAAWLRARARIDGKTAAEVRASAEETLAILDAALVLRLDAQCLLARIDLARAADMPEVFIESAAELARATYMGALVLWGEEGNDIRRALSALDSELSQMREDPRLRPERVDVVRSVVTGGPPSTSGF